MNATFRPRQRSRASAYATGTLETTTPIVASTEYSSVFSVQRQSGAALKTSTKLCHTKGWGQRRDDSAWSLVISAVNSMKAMGARKAIAAAIRKLWFATASKRRLRRTLAGGRLRANGRLTPDALIGSPPCGGPTVAS